MGLASLLSVLVGEESKPLLSTAALWDRSCGMGCGQIIAQLAPGMLASKSNFSKKLNFYMRPQLLNLCDSWHKGLEGVITSPSQPQS